MAFDASELGFRAREDLEEEIANSLKAWPSSISLSEAHSSMPSSNCESEACLQSKSPLTDLISDLLLENEQAHAVWLDAELADIPDLALYREHERWFVDRDTAMILATMLPRETCECAQFAHYQPWSDIMIELPILAYDHELYMQEVWERNNARVQPEAAALLFPDTNLEYTWNSCDIDSKARLDNSLSHSKLSVSGHTRSYLTDSIHGWNDRIKYIAIPMPSCTPTGSLKEEIPLIPLEVVSDLCPGSELAECRPGISLSSSSENGRSEVARRVKDMIDMPLTYTEGIKEEPLHMRLGETSEAEDLSLYFDKPELRKATSPLLLQSGRSGFATTESSCIEQNLKTIDDVFSSSSALGDDEDLQQLRLFAQSELDVVLRKLEQEQLNELVTTLRLPTTKPEHDLLHDAWPRYCDRETARPHKEPAWHAYIPSTERRWKGVSKLERSLQWMPFDLSLARVKLDEVLETTDTAALLGLPIWDDWICTEMLLPTKKRQPIEMGAELVIRIDDEEASRGASVAAIDASSNTNEALHPGLRVTHAGDKHPRPQIERVSTATQTRKRHASSVACGVKLSDLVRKRVCRDGMDDAASSLLEAA